MQCSVCGSQQVKRINLGQIILAAIGAGIGSAIAAGVGAVLGALILGLVGIFLDWKVLKNRKCKQCGAKWHE